MGVKSVHCQTIASHGTRDIPQRPDIAGRMAKYRGQTKPTRKTHFCEPSKDGLVATKGHGRDANGAVMNGQTAMVKTHRERVGGVLRHDQHRTTERQEIVTLLRRTGDVATNLLRELDSEGVFLSAESEIDDRLQGPSSLLRWFCRSANVGTKVFALKIDEACDTIRPLGRFGEARAFGRDSEHTPA